MAKVKEKARGDKKMIIEAFTEMAKERNIDRDLLQGILEETLSQLIRKKYGADSNFEIVVNMDKGDIEIYLMKEIVEKVENEQTEISLQEAIEKSGEQYEIGDEYIEEITLDNIGENFGRRLITLASQGLNQRIRDIEKENIYNEYIDRVGDIIVGEVYQIRRNDILVMHNKVELRLPREEQIPNETYKGKKNQTIKALLKEVRRGGSGGVPELILSRATDEFLAKLFEVEIPEIYDGIIIIKAIARDPGERSKVAVMSTDDRVDPVGACVGMKGIRIHSIVRELNNENIDLIEYSDNPKVFIAKALLPAKIKEITISEETRTATVVVSEDQVPLAIGKNGQNVRLASKLTGYSITLIKEGGEDIELVEFKEELGLALFQELKALGIETAREFLEYDIGKLLQVKGMTKDLLIEMRSIILAEFDETESQEILENINNYEAREDNETDLVQEIQVDDKDDNDDEIILDFEE
mgnify:FL=1